MSKHDSPDTTDMPLSGLEDHDEFIMRHIGPRDEHVAHMLNEIGVSSLDELISGTLPPSIQINQPLDLPPSKTEQETLVTLHEMAAQNRVLHSMIGMGYHETILPAVIQRNVLENPGWYTAYTPYQAEISQGRLEALLNFQQMVCDLTGMPIANASLLDEATAAAEAMTMLQRMNRKSKSPRFLVDSNVLPQTLDVVENRALYFGIEVVVGRPEEAISDGEYFGVLLQYPGCDGGLSDYRAVIARAHDNGALVTVATDLMSLVLLTPPGEMDADVVVGSAQRFGVPMGYGGPHAAFFATREAYKRSMPGRIIGVSQDSKGRTALRMALQTREQHIRRDKATSNICTAQALLAVISGLYGVWHGRERLKKIARRIHRLSGILATGLRDLGYASQSDHWFDTLTAVLDADTAEAVYQRALDSGINLRRIGPDELGMSVNEKTTRAHIDLLLRAFAGGEPPRSVTEIDLQMDADWTAIPPALQRASDFLQHPVFYAYHSETEMLRYLKRLENKDLSLAHAMISLGSCTMKLNATTEMIPITWPGFSDIHPFAPPDQVEGYRQLIGELEKMLVVCTGYDAVSLQPNAGSQGEYAGLLAIKAYHESRGDEHRDICLIPSSAHGTNPASAAMAGMKIIVVKCDDKGNVDLNDLQARAQEHSDRLGALMITYPSTHGVFEEDIREICEVVHQHGGQVYLDGANLNALVGCAAPGKFGADVSHLNLHKTFCIPHGGGGPGVGPICVGKHLQPFLPGHSVVAMDSEFGKNRAIAAAPWGSAGILPISWAYITMMGRDGMKKATQVAILNANYIASRLNDAYPVLYKGRNGRVAHECIIDIRPFKEACGVSEEDVAKRLIDYGFHSPTMSFPVPGTLMIEPTESESLAEIDRFCDAMLSIREEIRAVENGQQDALDNPLKNAPHTPADLAGEWNHAYTRAQAAYPVPDLYLNKFWAPVSRVDNVFGDRNLICSCPPPEAWIVDPDED
ncbi:MAG: aminomethyl-transferring glycine dehydrogenase [Xanthomonadales bacterium]|jgi:glycine dehydrogenase|nr:aminomethyl-transferring glycine dehydrogenase [Xanthomonadales bacterium]MDH3939373.1 aminomethyl-transferring glycine dehydrogenase [Xanthomonadales bacterium]MDH4000859.1 aminomethyl-transferring glycine dehydrogenase [Xanthomonadales bacterium]